MHRTKIIATLGPSVSTLNRMKALIRAGCDIARINTAHGTLEEHRELIDLFRRASKEVNKTTGILLDIKGPEIRTGDFEQNVLVLKTGQQLILTPKPILGTSEKIYINTNIAPYIRPQDIILIDDGKIELRVLQIKDEEVITRVTRGGTIKSRRGVNIPGRTIETPYLTKRDEEAIKFALENDIDFIAASFTRSSSDIYEIRQKMFEIGGCIPIIAKIENKSGIRRINNILTVADAIMVARGDLGVELRVEQVPAAQKHLLKQAKKHAKPAIIATQILESMVENPTPTRAEVSDIANAILDGADALMLSEETAMGKHPIEAVKMLNRTARAAEVMLFKHKKFSELSGGISHNISNAAVLLTKQVHARAIVCITRSGKTARLISRHRPQAPIIVATYSQKVLRRTSILWGTMGFVIEKGETTDEVIENTMEEALKRGLIHRKDVLVVSASDPSGIPGTTNVIRVHIMGSIIGRGTAFGSAHVCGFVVLDPNYNKDSSQNTVLVVETMPDLEIILRFDAVIIDSYCYDPAILKKAEKKGVVIMAGVRGIIDRVKEGEILNIDPERGVIWR